MGIIEKAKEAKEAAAAKVAEMKDQAAAKASELREHAADRASEIREHAAAKATELKDHAAAKATELKDHAAAKVHEAMEAGLHKLQETLADFNAALPVLRSAGYSVGGVKIALGLPPKIVARFIDAGSVTPEQIAEVEAAHADQKLAVLLLKSLYQARRLQDSVHIGGLKPKGISIEIGLLPVIVVEFG